MADPDRPAGVLTDRRWRYLAVTLIGLAVVAACTSSAETHVATKAGTGTDQAQTAIVYLQQGRQLIADVAKAAVPGAVVEQTVSDGPPGKCTSPLSGFVFFSISRDFTAPAGRTGASALTAIATALRSRGFSTTPTESGGAFDTLHATFDATGDDAVGVAAMGSPTSGLIRIGVDTRCGQPSAEDDNVGTAPTASAS